MSTPAQKVSALTLLGLYLVLSLASVLPFLLAEHPPLHDYYHWMFVGYLLAHFLAPGPTNPEVASFYELDPGLPPNVAAPLGIGLLTLWLPPQAATRIFASACAVAFGCAYGYFVRSVQRRPTALELGGFVWAHGFLMYGGYLSDQFALALVFVAIGWLHRMLSRPDAPRPTELMLMSLLSTAAYLSHLLAWLVLAAVLGVGAIRLLLDGRVKRALLLGATQAPALALLVWYTVSKKSEPAISFYGKWVDKVENLVSPLLPFLRTDPFPAPFPTFWANIAVVAGLATLALGQVARPRVAHAGGLSAAAGALLLVAAVANPIKVVSEAYNPDARLVLPAVLLLAGSLAWSTLSQRRAIAIAVFVALVLGAHAVEYRRASGYLAEIKSIVERHVAPGTSLLYMQFPEFRSRATCADDPGISFGKSAAKWFDLERMVEIGAVRTRLIQSSLVRNRPSNITDHWVEAIGADSLERDDLRRRLLIRTSYFEAVAVVRCSIEADAVRKLLEPSHEVVEESDWLTLLRRRPHGPREVP